MHAIKLLLSTLLLAFALAAAPFAVDWRSPLLFVIRRWALWALVFVPIVMIVAQTAIIWSSSPRHRVTRIVGALGIIAAVFVSACTLVLEGRFQWTKQIVLNTSPDESAPLGRHLIVGYRRFAEVRKLVRRRAIAGVFVSSMNVGSGNGHKLRDEISELQRIRRKQGLPRLWIATDQEGGIVSRLSPPLPKQPPLSDIVKKNVDTNSLMHAVRRYALVQGEGLAELGVNLNFSPVVDLNHNVVNPNDKLSRISERALSDDPEIVTRVAKEYCRTLEQCGVTCVLKHFPGLGRVYEDTHTRSASLSTSAKELAKTDWKPFRALMSDSRVFTMLGHVRLAALDKENPSSISPKVITGLLRNKWKHDGVLITDNVTMWAVYRSRLGIDAACVQALNAGVDLILVSYDPDQYYRIMYALLKAYRNGAVSRHKLKQSDRRLERAAGYLPKLTGRIDLIGFASGISRLVVGSFGTLPCQATLG